MRKKCERCGAKSPSATAGAFALFDYCAICSRDLCDVCMKIGCCGKVPANGGSESDNSLTSPDTMGFPE